MVYGRDTFRFIAGTVIEVGRGGAKVSTGLPRHIAYGAPNIRVPCLLQGDAVHMVKLSF